MSKKGLFALKTKEEKEDEIKEDKIKNIKKENVSNENKKVKVKQQKIKEKQHKHKWKGTGITQKCECGAERKNPNYQKPKSKIVEKTKVKIIEKKIELGVPIESLMTAHYILTGKTVRMSKDKTAEEVLKIVNTLQKKLLEIKEK